MIEAIFDSKIVLAIKSINDARLWHLDKQGEAPTKANLFALMEKVKKNWHDNVHVSEIDDMTDAAGNSIRVLFKEAYRQYHILGHESTYIDKSTQTIFQIDQPFPETDFAFRTIFDWNDHHRSRDLIFCQVLLVNTKSGDHVTRNQHTTIFRGQKTDGLSDKWHKESESPFKHLRMSKAQLTNISIRAYQIAFDQLGRRMPTNSSQIIQLSPPHISEVI